MILVNGFTNSHLAIIIKLLEIPSTPELDLFLNVQSLVKFYYHLLSTKLIGLQKWYVNNPESGDWNQSDLLVMDQYL